MTPIERWTRFATAMKFKAKGFPLRQYQKPEKIEFPKFLPIAFAVCSVKCGNRQHIVDGSTQVCDYCGKLMYRTAVRTYVLKRLATAKSREAQKSNHISHPVAADGHG
jgi:hypothetical protein